MLDCDPGELNARGDAQFAEGLTEVMGNGVGTDVHASCDPVVVQSLSDKAGDGLLGGGQAVPPHDRSGAGTCTPVAAPDAQLAEPPPDARLVPAGAHLPGARECRRQAIDGLIPFTFPFVQDAEVLCRRRPGPRIRVLCRSEGQAGPITMDQAQSMGGGRGIRPELRVSGCHRRGSIGGGSGQLLVSCGQRGACEPRGKCRITQQGPWPAREVGAGGSEAAESRSRAIAGLNDLRFGEAAFRSSVNIRELRAADRTAADVPSRRLDVTPAQLDDGKHAPRGRGVGVRAKGLRVSQSSCCLRARRSQTTLSQVHAAAHQRQSRVGRENPPF